MNNQAQEHLDNLVVNINQMIKVYRLLLDVVRNEKQILIDSNLDALNKNNVDKETLLVKIGQLEKGRVVITNALATELSLTSENARLLPIANEIGGEAGDGLRKLHSVLVLLLKRVKEFNDQNESLVNSALLSVTGAINNLKQSLNENPVYDGGKRKGDANPTQSGRLVNKQV